MPNNSGFQNVAFGYSGITGSYGLVAYSDDRELDFDDKTMDKLLAKMMVHTTKVIIPCRYCGSHNAFSNPTCVKCGAPLG